MAISTAKIKQDNFFLYFQYTVKLVYNDHRRDPKFVVVVERWSLMRMYLDIFKLQKIHSIPYHWFLKSRFYLHPNKKSCKNK